MIMRKRTNALSRRYQRTTNNEEQRENRKNQYPKAKKEYQAAIKRERIRSWEQYCSATSPNNPWNEIYKLANNKTRCKQIITMRKPDGTKTETMTETLQLIMDQLIPEDKHKEDSPTTGQFGTKQNNHCTQWTIRNLQRKNLSKS